MNFIRSRIPPSGFDPFQIFEVTPEPCHVLRISNLRAANITKGWAGDLMDTPDPYIVFQVKDTPNGRKRTKHINNEVNPTWDETFEFYTSAETNCLEVILMDANYTIDETLGVQNYDMSRMRFNEEKDVTLTFNVKTQVMFTLLLTLDKKPDLRYSLALCDEEKIYLQKRNRKVFAKMKELLGHRGPEKESEVPVIGVLGSGGGFRAMVCLSGIFNALTSSGILDCATYVAGLSGSSWYISTLYSHPDFPAKSAIDLQPELQEHIGHTPFRLLSPQGLCRYTGSIVSKHMSGQPISFTDFFGHLLGDTLLKNRKESKLSDQKQKIEDGSIPLPLYTCLHVKKNVAAKVFQEWIDFSPYEVGIAKYGTFMRSEMFGSKLYLGHVVKKYHEFPLHYLQGVWGSAFCILFRQLVRENGRKDLAQIMRENNSNHDESELDDQLKNFKIGCDDVKSESESEEECEVQVKQSQKSLDQRKKDGRPTSLDKGDKLHNPRALAAENRRQSKVSLWQGICSSVFSNSWLDSYAGRAGMIHNPLRGLKLNYLYPISPFSPTCPNDDVDFKGNNEALPTEAKKLYLVDSGLTFNSPYPLLLRPQRGVDLYLSFDFSARPKDSTPPFKELLLAEKWSKHNNTLFPPIEEIARTYADEPVRECYVFQHPRDPYCPVIIHFVIINSKFRQFKAPGVPRETEEELKFADFDIFDDPKNPFSLYNFNYSTDQFDRLSKLMEFNFLDSLELVKRVIADTIERKRFIEPKPVISLSDIAKLKMRFRNQGDAIKRLKAYVRSFSKDELVAKMQNCMTANENGLENLKLES